jgi:hypothetical protein
MRTHPDGVFILCNIDLFEGSKLEAHMRVPSFKNDRFWFSLMLLQKLWHSYLAFNSISLI